MLPNGFGGLVANEAVTFDVEEGEIVGVVDPMGPVRPHCLTPSAVPTP